MSKVTCTLFLVLSFVFLIPYQFAIANDKPIQVTLIGFKDDTDMSKKKICKLHFRVKNNSFGTIYSFSLSVDAIDDRGETVREMLSASVDPFAFSFKEKSIPVGGSLKSVTGAIFKTSCKFIREVKAVGVKNRYCGIRNFPEKVNCYDFVQVNSELENVKFNRK
jgi:hypothetical protein